MAGLEDLLGSILGGGQAPAAPGAGSSAAPGGGGFDVSNVGNMSADLNKIMMIAGPILAMMARQGGLSDLLGKLSSGGLGNQANSWVGTGPNSEVSPDQVASAMPDEVGAIAQQAGLDPAQVSQGLAQLLPGLVNTVTPDGAVPSSPQELEQILSQLPGGDQVAALLSGQQ